MKVDFDIFDSSRGPDINCTNKNVDATRVKKTNVSLTVALVVSRLKA